MSVLFIDSTVDYLVDVEIRNDIRFIEDTILSLDIITFLRQGNIKNLFDYKMYRHHETQYKVIISDDTWSEYRDEIHKLFDYIDTVNRNIADLYIYEDGKIQRVENPCDTKKNCVIVVDKLTMKHYSEELWEMSGRFKGYRLYIEDLMSLMATRKLCFMPMAITDKYPADDYAVIISISLADIIKKIDPDFINYWHDALGEKVKIFTIQERGVLQLWL